MVTELPLAPPIGAPFLYHWMVRFGEPVMLAVKVTMRPWVSVMSAGWPAGTLAATSKGERNVPWIGGVPLAGSAAPGRRQLTEPKSPPPPSFWMYSTKYLQPA